MSSLANFDVGQERVRLLTDIASISQVARNYIESGRAIDDSPDAEESTITTTLVLDNVVDILLSELEQLGIRFNEPVEQMVGDLYRVGLLVAVRKVFDGDLFWGMLKIIPETTRRSIFTHVDNAMHEDTDPGELIQLIIVDVAEALKLSDDWSMLLENVGLFASTHRLVEHLDRVIDRFVPEAPVTVDAVADVSKVIERLDIQRQRFAFALGMLNSIYANPITADELLVLVRDYEREIPQMLTSVGMLNHELTAHRSQVPYHFMYYITRNINFTKKSIIMISAAIYASVPYLKLKNVMSELGQTYHLTYEVQKLFTEMLNALPEPNPSVRLPEEM